MTEAEKIYELVKTMSNEQVHTVLAFVEALGVNSDLQLQTHLKTIPAGTLTGLRGIARQSETALTDKEIREEYTDYLVKKYQ